MKRTHVAALAALVLLATPALTGCFNGPRATTTTQATMNSGNGVATQKGAMHIENATLVMGPEGSGSVTLVVRLVNTGPATDALTYATIDGKPADIVFAGGASSDLAPGSTTGFGYDSDNRISLTSGFDVPVSNYVPVELGFREAGLATMQVLTVPPVGIYEGITPAP
ncbi:MAG: hypothetical protein GC156_07505 [Actinomycetales bacterium]|nr:hypothetical protein [Actinomycetales bacterium]